MLDTIAWSQPSTYTTGTGVHHGYSTAPAPQEALSYLERLRQRFARVEKLWYAKLDPGGFIIPHIDQGPWLERWHYPISGYGYVWQEAIEDHFTVQDGLRIVATSDKPYRMNHHRPHAVWNPYDEPRVVLIVEYDNPVDQPTTDLILCDMIPEIQTMIDNI